MRLAESDDVKLVPGCGIAKTTRLHANGIKTIGDLLACSIDVPTVNIPALQKAAKQCLNPIVKIDAHSWMDRVCHIMRSKGKIQRCIVKDLHIGSHYISLEVQFQKSRQAQKLLPKIVSPAALFCMNVFWLQKDIMSDDSETEDATFSMEKITILPKFFMNIDSPKMQQLSAVQLKAIHQVVKEVNQLRHCLCP